jgi:hypothetical protein
VTVTGALTNRLAHAAPFRITATVASTSVGATVTRQEVSTVHVARHHTTIWHVDVVSPPGWNTPDGSNSCHAIVQALGSST